MIASHLKTGFHDQQNHWVQWGTSHFQTHPIEYAQIISNLITKVFFWLLSNFARLGPHVLIHIMVAYNYMSFYNIFTMQHMHRYTYNIYIYICTGLYDPICLIVAFVA